jgi:catechol 2,3-dioxygenase-like lactoylglutathione lyase family enzyme
VALTNRKEIRSMFSHVSVGATDVARAAEFFDAFLAPLGITRFWTEPEGRVVGWRRDGEAGGFFVGTPFNQKAPNPGNGWMCAFAAPSRDAVRQAYAAALAYGGTDEGAPGVRPHYSPDYYGAYVRDPDGNKLHVVHRGP